MKLPCELIVWYVLPSIRKELAIYYTKDLKMTQKQAAQKLGLTESAVSQYLKSKRGCELKFPKEISEKIKISLKDISEKDDDCKMIETICSICSSIKNRGSLCSMHRSQDEALANCRACMEACE